MISAESLCDACGRALLDGACARCLGRRERCGKGTLYSPELRIAVSARCGLSSCTIRGADGKTCGQRKAARVAARAERLQPDYLLTLSLRRSAWASPASLAELQQGTRWLMRYMQRHGLISAYCWVREEGAPNPECVCNPSLDGCLCGANGRQLHRHYLLRLGTEANRYGRKWLPYEALQAAAVRCGLGTLDFRPVVTRDGAARYVAKYIGKTIGAVTATMSLALRRARRYAFNVPDDTPPPVGGFRFSWQCVAAVAVKYLGAVAVDWDATRWSYDASG